MDCGPTCLQMIAKFYGKTFDRQVLRDRCSITREGVSLLGISDAAESVGFSSYGARLSVDTLEQDVALPTILHWQQNHFVVLYEIKGDQALIGDPELGLMKLDRAEFLEYWSDEDEAEGIALILEPSPDFYTDADEAVPNRDFSFIWRYFQPHQRLLWQLALGLLLASLLTLALPFLTQAVVDVGINNRDLNFIVLILAAQIILYLSRSVVEAIRNYIILHVTTRVNIAIVSDFLSKIVRLRLAEIETKTSGDLLQRINDHHRIEEFFTSSVIGVALSLFNLLIFGLVLWIYNAQIFGIFLFGSAIAIAWILLFQRARRRLDQRHFLKLAKNQSALLEIIEGIREIKIHGIENLKKWQWQNIQVGEYKIRLRSLTIEQAQEIGASVINEIKNIVILFLTAQAVLNGELTLGAMLAIAFILGQLNAPLAQLTDFFHSFQEARLSFLRMQEVHAQEDEEDFENKIVRLPGADSIVVENVCFRYGGPREPLALDDVSLNIPAGKVTAIVGSSGSGKSSLLKLLLKLYGPESGKISVGEINLDLVHHKTWREKCGVVMQDGYIFSDTIARNIALEAGQPDTRRLVMAARVANATEFIEALPRSYNTRIGDDGLTLSQGQQQRILIARAVYKDPDYLFFDEATSALDATNERVIKTRLDEFFEGKTVLIIAHRLSTVRNADHIVVLEHGRVVETGNHDSLLENRGAYYHLVRDQLELGA